jgi:hypothetical protein
MGRCNNCTIELKSRQWYIKINMLIGLNFFVLAKAFLGSSSRKAATNE